MNIPTLEYVRLQAIETASRRLLNDIAMSYDPAGFKPQRRDLKAALDLDPADVMADTGDSILE